MKSSICLVILLGLISAIGILAQCSLFYAFLCNWNAPQKEVAELSQEEYIPNQLSWTQEHSPLTSFFSPFVETRVSPIISTYTPHAPINISSDVELAAVAVSGSGTQTEPYLLEGWQIITAQQHALFITGTTQYFIIQNCWLETGGGSWDFQTVGIYLQNVAPATALIQNNTCHNNWFGIRIYNTHSSLIRNNICSTNNYLGITLEYSNHSTIIDNICSTNQENGILGVFSTNMTVRNNICYKNGIGIHINQCEALWIMNNTCTQNRNEGITIGARGSVTVLNNTCTYNGWEGISLYSPEVSTISHNLCQYNNRTGLRLITPKHCTIRDNSLSHNKGSGILFDRAENLTLTHSSCSYNHMEGLTLESSTACWSNKNLFLENKGYGILLDATSMHNLLDHNSFLKNNNGSLQALDNGTLNHWYDTSTNAGNFWWDYDGSGVYQLAGTANATDPYPLADVLDFDADGLPDRWEYQVGLDPCNSQDASQDADNDGMPNLWEYQMNLNVTWDDAKADPDNDGLTNFQEYQMGTDPHDSDSDNDFFPDNWDHGWWGNPHNKWDNLLIRTLLLLLVIGVVGVGPWVVYIAYHLPKIQRDLTLLHHHFQQYVQQFQENITFVKTQENLEEFETVASQISEAFQSYEDFYSFAQRLVKHKWLRTFLRPELTQWKTTFATLQQMY
ncbi:MAG: right-handed parallel beta-helix repeat-containing protein [Candidatus Hodarchaeota archaeon]